MDEQIGEADRLIEQPAGIAAQIEHDPGQAAARLAAFVRERLRQALGRALVEAEDLKDRDIADPRHRYGREHDECTLQLEVVGQRAAGTRHPQHDAAADWTAEPLDHLALRQPGYRDAVDRDDRILGLHPGLRGRALRRHRSDPERIGGGVEGDADAAETVTRGALVARRIRRRIAREAVERSRHAIEYRLD